MDRDAPKSEAPVKAEKRSLSPSLESHSASPTDPSQSLHAPIFSNSPSLKSVKSSEATPQTPDMKEEIIGAEISVKMETGKAPKLSRTASKKIVTRPPPMFNDEPDAYVQATSTFSVITDCIYANKHMGSTEPALECDCQEEWESGTQTNDACGEDSDCINRATKMECLEDCSCGSSCQNMRFQRKEFANVTVFKTEKKGYGLRADTDLRPNQFIFEYIGEVINEPNFRRRTRQYDEEGIKHFYFMSLSKGEFIDATKKGNLGRFCNHSCNPNCYVDKWVVGDKLRMGIFAERYVKEGEELVFNYNVDRYGADPQPCYCGEPNCTGFIGGKTQTESGTKLSNATIEALGIDEYDDWEYAVPKKSKKARKTEEHDEEYVSAVQPKSLEEDGVTKVMAALMQCKEKWIAVKLLGRIQRADDAGVMNRVVRMHGYRILKTALATFIDDANVCLQVLDVLFKLPRITRNKIQDSGIEETVTKAKMSEDERVAKQASEILDIWSELKVAYRIPRVKRDPNIAPIRSERPGRREYRERSKSPPKTKSPVAPTGPKNNVPQRAPPYMAGNTRPRAFNPLPKGWYAANDGGRVYYYDASGNRTWNRPTVPAALPPPMPKQQTHEERLQEIINSITRGANTPKDSPSANTPKKQETVESPKLEKWRSYPLAKQQTIYENTLSPHIRHVLNKYKDKLPRDELKRLAKEISKIVVASDYKRNRVSDPTTVSSKHAQSVKSHVKEYFEKGVIKYHASEKASREKRKNGQSSRKPVKDTQAESTTPTGMPGDASLDNGAETPVKEVEELDLEDTAELERKRKRDGSRSASPLLGEDSDTMLKKARTEELDGDDIPPPPPPPPPPADEMEVDGSEQNGHGPNGTHKAIEV